MIYYSNNDSHIKFREFLQKIEGKIDGKILYKTIDVSMKDYLSLEE